MTSADRIRLVMWPGSVLVLAWIAVLAPLRHEATAETYTLHTFKKITLSPEFYCEGAHFADFDCDGTMDVVAGPFWYEGPAFAKRHEYYPAEAFDPIKYSGNFLTFTHDFNADQWSDILVIGFPGQAAYWYENPHNGNGHWKKHVAFEVVDNESPAFGDLNGDGRPELIFHTAGRLGYAEPDWKNPTQPWKFHPVSARGEWQRYTHGFGFGDVNGDGRADLVLREGWWEQPAQDQPGKAWKHHPVEFTTERGGAQMYAYDVDGDGDNDVVTSLWAHGFGLAWFEQKRDDSGNISFKKHLIMGSQPSDNAYGVKFSQLHSVDLVDMDGDGVKDIVTGKRFWAHGPKGDDEPNAPAVLYWFRTVRQSDGGMQFVPYQVDNDSGVGTQVIAGDLNGDGLPEIIVGNKKGSFVFLHESRDVTRDSWMRHQPKEISR